MSKNPRVKNPSFLCKIARVKNLFLLEGLKIVFFMQNLPYKKSFSRQNAQKCSFYAEYFYQHKQLQTASLFRVKLPALKTSSAPNLPCQKSPALKIAIIRFTKKLLSMDKKCSSRLFRRLIFGSKARQNRDWVLAKKNPPIRLRE